MKFLLKTFFITFIFIQFAQAGRFYSEEQGRFIQRDPLGYVDGMSLYNAYFAENFNLDPTGLKIQDPPAAPPKEFTPFPFPGKNSTGGWMKPNWSFDIAEHVIGGCCFLEVNMSIDPKFFINSNRKDISSPDQEFTLKSGKKTTVREHEEEHWHITIKHYKKAAEELKAYEYFEVPCGDITKWRNLLSTIYNLHVSYSKYDNGFHDYVDYGDNNIEKDGDAIENAVKNATKASRATGR